MKGGVRYLVQPRADIRTHDKLDALDLGLHEHDPRVFCLGRVGIPTERLGGIRLEKDDKCKIAHSLLPTQGEKQTRRTCLRMWSRREPRSSACTGSMSGACRSLSQCRTSCRKSVSRGAPKSSAMGPGAVADPAGAPAMGTSSSSSRSVRRGGIAAITGHSK